MFEGYCDPANSGRRGSEQTGPKPSVQLLSLFFLKQYPHPAGELGVRLAFSGEEPSVYASMYMLLVRGGVVVRLLRLVLLGESRILVRVHLYFCFSLREGG